MFLGMKDKDFCPNLIKFYPLYPNLTKNNLLGGCGSSYATHFTGYFRSLGF